MTGSEKMKGKKVTTKKPPQVVLNPADLLQNLSIHVDDAPFNHFSVDLKNGSNAF